MHITGNPGARPEPATAPLTAVPAPRRQVLHCAALLLLLMAVSGCRQQMAEQPKYLPLAASTFFADGRSARPLVTGTVARGATAEDYLSVAKDSNDFPFTLTREVLDRGQQRYNIYCAPCHGLAGDGNGVIVQRGFRHPPSYHIERLRAAPLGHFYDVITNGFGAMQDYSAQIPPRDRWAIIAYIRALQLSQHVPTAELSPVDRQRLNAEAAR